MILFLQYSYEQLFRSVHYALMDNACREYLFIADFFSLTSAAAQEMFDSIFTKTQAFLLVSRLFLIFSYIFVSLSHRNTLSLIWRAVLILLEYFCVFISTSDIKLSCSDEISLV